MTNKLNPTQVAQMTAKLLGQAYKRPASYENAVAAFDTAFIERAGHEVAMANRDAILQADDLPTAKKLLDKVLDEHAKAFKDKKEAETPKAQPKAQAAAKGTKAKQAQAAKAAKQTATDKRKADADADYRDTAKVDAIMKKIMKKVGAGKVGDFRKAWIEQDATGYGKLATTQQKGIMRKSINRLTAEKAIKKVDGKYSLSA